LVGDQRWGGVRAGAHHQVDVVGHDRQRLDRPPSLGAFGLDQAVEPVGDLAPKHRAPVLGAPDQVQADAVDRTRRAAVSAERCHAIIKQRPDDYSAGYPAAPDSPAS
jgi:hypothetical protein